MPPSLRGEIKLDTRVLDRMSAEIADKAEQVVSKLAFDVEAGAKQNITAVGAVDTGALHASVYTSTRRSSSYRTNTSDAFLLNPDATIDAEIQAPDRFNAVVGVPMDYAAFVELGTVKMGARPYLLPAVERVRAKAAQAWAVLFK